MIFRPLIDRWDVAKLATDLGLPTKNVRRWWDNDSIPAEWFAAVVRAARRRSDLEVTAASLAQLAEQRRLAKGQGADTEAA